MRLDGVVLVWLSVCAAVLAQGQPTAISPPQVSKPGGSTAGRRGVEVVVSGPLQRRIERPLGAAPVFRSCVSVRFCSPRDAAQGSRVSRVGHLRMVSADPALAKSAPAFAALETTQGTALLHFLDGRQRVLIGEHANRGLRVIVHGTRKSFTVSEENLEYIEVDLIFKEPPVSDEDSAWVSLEGTLVEPSAQAAPDSPARLLVAGTEYYLDFGGQLEPQLPYYGGKGAAGSAPAK
jgi:hypothetical protein